MKTKTSAIAKKRGKKSRVTHSTAALLLLAFVHVWLFQCIPPLLRFGAVHSLKGQIRTFIQRGYSSVWLKLPQLGGLKVPRCLSCPLCPTPPHTSFTFHHIRKGSLFVGENNVLVEIMLIVNRLAKSLNRKTKMKQPFTANMCTSAQEMKLGA